MISIVLECHATATSVVTSVAVSDAAIATVGTGVVVAAAEGSHREFVDAVMKLLMLWLWSQVLSVVRVAIFAVVMVFR